MQIDVSCGLGMTVFLIKIPQRLFVALSFRYINYDFTMPVITNQNTNKQLSNNLRNTLRHRYVICVIGVMGIGVIRMRLSTSVIIFLSQL